MPISLKAHAEDTTIPSHIRKPLGRRERFSILFLMKNNVQPRNLCVLSPPVVSGSLRPHGLKPTRLPCSWNSPGKNTGMCCHSLSSVDIPEPEIEPGSPELQADSLPSKPPGKPF